MSSVGITTNVNDECKEWDLNNAAMLYSDNNRLTRLMMHYHLMQL